MIQFPKNFFWGSATSSYQVEGENSNADWWPWEIKANKEKSGSACRHFENYEHDFDLIKGLHHNAHRLSIEWSRIEPREGEFSKEALQHYINVIQSLRVRGIEPMVTLHHFTNPIWFSESGNWIKPNSVKRFLKYCEFTTRGLAPYVKYWFTINEPSVYFSHAFLWGMWPPQEKSVFKTKAVHDHLNEAHIKSYHLMNKIYQELKLPKPMISIAHHMQAIVGTNKSIFNKMAVSFIRQLYNLEILDTLTRAKTLDYIGVNYYSRNLVFDKNHDPRTKNSLGWDIYPEGLTQVLLDIKKYELPVIISENGICTLEDQQRWEYIQSHIKAVHAAITQGVDVRGYLYWSLMDNFEWAHGYGPRFGLIDIDYKAQTRTIRDSAKKYAQICQTNRLES